MCHYSKQGNSDFLYDNEKCMYIQYIKIIIIIITIFIHTRRTIYLLVPNDYCRFNFFLLFTSDVGLIVVFYYTSCLNKDYYYYYYYIIIIIIIYYVLPDVLFF